jgi:FAS-associated factor 2
VARTPQQQFLFDFAKQYGPHVPEFFPGSYTDAVKEAKSRGRMLFLYLHCTTHDDTDAFVRNTLCTESMCNFLRENFVAWAGSIKSTDAYKLAQTLSVASFPYVAALSPQGGASSVAVVFRHTGPIGVEELMSQLLLRMETHESILGTLAAQRSSADASRDSARELREQQDAEYAESLLMDQTAREAKAREQAEMEEILRQSREAEEAVEAARQAAEAEAERARVEAEAARAAMAASMPPEPAAGEEGVVSVSLRLPTGAKKIARRFRDSEPLGHVRQWAQTLEELSELGIGSRFHLLSTYPRKVHDDPAQTLAELKLGKQILFVVEAIEEDEEDEKASDGAAGSGAQ